MQTRQEFEELEQSILAPYASKAACTRGRKHTESPGAYRSCYQRDRDRVIHSTAFRRLEYKTQVFVNHEGDYYRTRLTHTIEVNQIARTIARSLRLNEDLVDAISLAHDIGHTPFGHAGEEILSSLMQDHGGFEHNYQGLRVVDELERRYPDFNGLNLTFETREGIISHTTDYDMPRRVPEFESTGTPTLEAQTINVADEIAYNSHDLDDGIKSGYIKLDELMQVTLWKEVHSAAAETVSEPSLRIYQAIRYLINRQVTDVITHTDRMIQKLRIKSCEDVRSNESIIRFSPEQLQLQRELKDFLYSHLYNHYKAIKMHNKARRYVEALFNTYVEDPRQLPPGFSQQKDKYQAVCDYIAGMTDRFAQDEYERLFTPYTKM